jgi:hypothetical protein
MSMPVPGVNGTTILIALLGYGSCAEALEHHATVMAESTISAPIVRFIEHLV